MNIYITVFILIMILSVADYFRQDIRRIILMFVTIAGVVFVAGRGDIGADGYNYVYSWQATATFFDNSLEPQRPLAYSEPGYYLLTVIIKTIWDNQFFYFAVISSLTLFFLLKSLHKYAIFPFVGLVVYMSRYLLLRDFNQIRAALAIAIVIYGTQYIAQQNIRKFLTVWIIAFLFHTSMIIVLPFYWLNRLRPTRKQLYQILIAAGCLSIIVNQALKSLIDYVSNTLNVLTAYTGENEMGVGSGMLNPMIYFQLVILILFIQSERYLKDKQPYYYTLRNGYLYSTIILMLFSSLMVIGARLSTVLATYDIFIIPALISMLNFKSRILVIPLVYILLTLLFILNLSRAGSNMNDYGSILY